MRILVAGGAGFIGRHLVSSLVRAQHTVTVLSRQSQPSLACQHVKWDGKTLSLDLECDIIINLCGIGIADRRWSEARKQQLLDSRLQPTAALVKFIENYPHDSKPRLINASAIGFYASDHALQSEDDYTVQTHANFSHQLVARWEEAAHQAAVHGSEVTCLRFAAVLGPDGGMLQKLLPSFRLGFGAVLGNANHYLSWVSLDDAVRAIIFIMQHDTLQPAYNICAPHACTQQGFAHALARALGRQCFLRLPKTVVTLLFGQMGRELLLANQRIIPNYLTTAGFSFSDTDIQSALVRCVRAA